jgi:hypothetical protein
LFIVQNMCMDNSNEGWQREIHMTNVSGNAEKTSLRAELFQIAVRALEEQGWKVERIQRNGKSSVRRISKGKTSKTVSIRTTQDMWIAFPRNKADDGWATLDDVDYVVASSVDDPENPHFAQVHMIEAGEMRGRFDRAYTARRKAGHVMQDGRGIWISLYEKESNDPVSFVGAGAGLAHPAIAREPLTAVNSGEGSDAEDVELGDRPLTIAEAKRLLALSLGVNEADIKITISS